MPLPKVLALLATALLFGACRDDPDAVIARDARVTIAQTDYRFDPQRIRAEPGSLTIELVNRARLPHNFRLEKNGRGYASQGSLLPGEQATVRAQLDRGTYRMLCTIANHEELGMYGTVVVR